MEVEDAGDPDDEGITDEFGALLQIKRLTPAFIPPTSPHRFRLLLTSTLLRLLFVRCRLFRLFKGLSCTLASLLHIICYK